jgi:hypothetical protein
MSFCAHHRMPLGPRGCPQCLRDEAAAHRAESRRFWRWVGIVFGAIAGLAILTVLLLPSPAAGRQLLDPGPFRSAIERIESALYATGRLTAGERDALARGLSDLETGIRRLRPSAAKRRALDPYARFCVVTAFEARQDTFDVPAARKQWEALRRSHFTPAPWFRASSAALQQAQTSSGSRGIPADTHLYQASIDRLRLVQARAEAELQVLAEDPAEMDFSDHQRWRQARPEVLKDIERLRSEYPVPFSGMEPGWRRAHDDLEEATREVAGLLRPTVYTSSLVPYGAEARARISRARAAVDQAQASLDAAPR